MDLTHWPKSSKELKVLKSIYCHQNISRPELKQETEIKGSTLYKIIDYLISKEIIQITGLTQNHFSGRRPELLQLRCDDNYVFSFVLKRTEYHLAIVSLSHKILAMRSFPIEKDLTPNLLVAHTRDTFCEMCTEIDISLSNIFALGLALVGPLDFGHGMLLGPTYFAASNWKNIPLVSMFEESFHIPIVFDTLARACLWGTYIPKFYKHYANIAYFTIGAGIGSGLLLHESIIENKDSIFDGLAHMTMEIGGRKCICGEYGCLEAYATTAQIPNILKREMAIGHNSSLQGIDDITFDLIALEASAGDPLCRNVLRECGIILAKAILNLLRIFHLEAIILGGEIIEKSDFFYQVVYEYIRKRVETLTIFKQEEETALALKGIAVKSILPLFDNAVFDE